MANEEEIRKIMAKARKASSGGKGPPHKKVKEKPDSGGTKKQSPSSPSEEKKPKPEIKSEEKPPIREKPGGEKKPDSPKPSSEIAELKTLITQQIAQQNQNITQQNERIGAIENFLKEAQRQAQAQMGDQPTQANLNKTIDQSVSEDGLTDEQRLTQLQAEQDQGGQGVPGQPPMPANVPPALAYLYAFNPTFKEIAATVRTAIAKGKMEKEGSEVSLDSLGRELIVGLIKRQLLGAGEGDNMGKQLNTFSDMQKTLLGGFFNTLKLLGKEGAQTMMNNIFREITPLGSPPGSPPSSEGHIV